MIGETAVLRARNLRCRPTTRFKLSDLPLLPARSPGNALSTRPESCMISISWYKNDSAKNHPVRPHGQWTGGCN